MLHQVPPAARHLPAAPTRTPASRALMALLALVLASLIGFLAWALVRPREDAGLARVHIREAPSFQVTTFDGGTLSYEQLRGQPLVVNFWASWCVPCETEAPALRAAAERYAGQVMFLGIDVQDSEEDARRFLERHRLPYPNGRDRSGEVSIAFGMTGVPETYFIDPHGQVLYKWNGPLTPQTLDRLVGALLERA